MNVPFRNRIVSVSMALALALGCGGSGRSSNTAHLKTDEDVVRYRLPLRDNPDKHDASLCYGECQRETSPSDYLSCLAECPNFEVTVGETCSKNDVPPVAACLVVRKMKQSAEPDQTGLVVLGVVGSFVLVVTAASLCASSSSTQCGYYDPVPRVATRPGLGSRYTGSSQQPDPRSNPTRVGF